MPHAPLKLPPLRDIAWTMFVATLISIVFWATEHRGAYGHYFVVSICLGVCIHTAFYFTRPFVPEHIRFSNVLYYTISILSGMVLGSLLAALILQQPVWRWLLGEQSTLIGTLLATFATSVYGTYYFTTRLKLAEDKNRLIALEQAVTQAELKWLEAQIEPHFLFNTLANLDSLIAIDPNAARHMLGQLSHYLRATLSVNREAITTLAAEEARLSAYLSLMQWRFGERLSWEIQIPANLKDTVLPPMLIQPLIENALSHGIEPTLAGGKIHLIVTQHAHQLYIDVIDNGAGLNTPPSHTGHGLALHNIRTRLAHQFGEQASLTLSSLPVGGTRSRLILPWTPR